MDITVLAVFRRGQFRYINRMLRNKIAGYNGGRWPSSSREWFRVCRGMRIRIRGTNLSYPELRIGRFTNIKILYLPRTDSEEQLCAWLLHEAVEAAMLMTDEPLFVYPAALGTHHELAVYMEHAELDPAA